MEFVAGEGGASGWMWRGSGWDARQEAMKSWRSGFMRWRRRDGPWSSHHVEARAEKWDTSSCETVEGFLGVVVGFGFGVEEEWRRGWRVGGKRRAGRGRG